MSAEATLVAEAVRVRQGHRDLLPPTSVQVVPGQVAVVVGDQVPPLTALALTVAGRLKPDHGTVRLGDDTRPGTLQAAVALVDVPGVSAPEPGVPVRTVVAEELAFARRRTGFRAAQQWLDERGLGDRAHGDLDELSPVQRLQVLTELASQRPGVTHLVLAAPERHGGAAEEWLAVVDALAADGFGVLVTVTRSVANDHDATAVIGGAAEGPATGTGDTTRDATGEGTKPGPRTHGTHEGDLA